MKFWVGVMSVSLMLAGCGQHEEPSSSVMVAEANSASPVVESHPHLGGMWDSNSQRPDFGFPPLDQVKMTEKGRALTEQFDVANDDEVLQCIKPGVPRAIGNSYPLQIVEDDVNNEIIFLYEYMQVVRHVYLDRQPESFEPLTRNGFSRGHWEGDTLVVETTHLSPQYMHYAGIPMTGGETTKVVERYRREGDTLTMEALIYDDEILLEPMLRKVNWTLNPALRIYEYECFPEFSSGEFQSK